MTKLSASDSQYNLYVDLVYFLNSIKGTIACDDGRYFDFLDNHAVTHRQVVRAVRLCTTNGSISPNRVGVEPYVLHRKVDDGCKDGNFYLTLDGTDIVFSLNVDRLPQKIVKNEQKIEKIEKISPKPVKNTKKPDIWTKERVFTLLTKEAHMVGRMLGQGYDLLTELHGKWIYEWIINPKNLSVMIHQAHRNSYKSSSLKLAIAILMILQPNLTIILIRKSEDAVKELVGGVSKILDTGLFTKFVEILHPDIVNKNGFKKTTDTALIINTNLNISLSGEPQLRGVGLGSPLTGMHSKMIITDDIVTLADRESDAERRNTISKYQELINIISTGKGFEGSLILNIGTPWHEEDAFSIMEKGLPPKSEIQVKYEQIPEKDRTDVLKEKIRKANMLRGLFVYNCYQTGLMTDEQINKKRQMLNDEVLFAANYLLALVNDTEKPFPKINNVGNYSSTFFTGDKCWEVFATIDAAYGGEDRTSMTIAAMDWENNTVVVLGKLWTGVAIDENYLELAEIMVDNNVSTLFMETNADKGLMGAKFRELGFNVEDYHEHTNKHTKIVSTIRPFWRESGAELMPCVQFVKETDIDYLSQIHNYKKGVKHDDAPDNLACALLKGNFTSLAIRII